MDVEYADDYETEEYFQNMQLYSPIAEKVDHAVRNRVTMEHQTEYDKKFAEMQKYVPFLESMVKRLQPSHPGSVNPREAQLIKMKSLRNLLLSQTKKMKMENLLKCEQVIINLFSKVGETDKSLPSCTVTPKAEIKEEAIEDEELQDAREKLKNIVVVNSSEINQPVETVLPKSPVSLPPYKNVKLPKNTVTVNTEVHAPHAPLYERRPRRTSRSHSASSRRRSQGDNKSPSAKSQRKYTRVLCSPEPDQRRWSPSYTHKSPNKVYDSSGKPLFQRRSPRKKSSPSYSPRAKNKKKSRKKNRSRSSSDQPASSCSYQDVNITLNVPEESLSSLSASDIFSRIVNCKEDDVDIKHLRELRAQIVNELKHTGANTDISDYILKSYKKKKRKKTKKDEIEEGELSDSESEKVKAIYGNLTVKVVSESKNVEDKTNKVETTESASSVKIAVNEGRKDSPKIKISLVLANPTEEDAIENTQVSTTDNLMNSPKPTTTFLEDVATSEGKNAEPYLDHGNTFLNDLSGDNVQVDNILAFENKNIYEKQTIPKESVDKNERIIKESNTETVECIKQAEINVSTIKRIANSIEAVSKPKQFYVPHVQVEELSDLLYKDLSPETSNTSGTEKVITSSNVEIGELRTVEREHCAVRNDNESDKQNTKIPFISESPNNERKNAQVISEIEILKALKNEILGETIDIVPAVETNSLHQPKLIKVTDKSQIESNNKKRISIENYKSKVAPTNKGLFIKHTDKDQSKIQSKGLTPRECERFSVVLNTFDDVEISDDDTIDRSSSSPAKYDENDMGPKSPENYNFSDSSPDSPITIPSEPVEVKRNDSKTNKTDVDMRVQTIIPHSVITSGEGSPQTNKFQEKNVIISKKSVPDFGNNYKNPDFDGSNSTENSVLGPNQDSSLAKPVIPTLIPGLTSRAQLSKLSRGAMTPSGAPQITPSRVLMTPTYSPRYGEEISGRRHVYAPSDLPDPSRTPSWDMMSSPLVRDDGSSTPLRDNFSGRSPMLMENRNNFGFCTPRHDPFNRFDDYNSSFDVQVNHENFHSINRQARDPRLCSERKEDIFRRDPRISSYGHGNRHVELPVDPRYSRNSEQMTSRFEGEHAFVGGSNFIDKSHSGYRDFSRASSVGRRFGVETRVGIPIDDNMKTNRDQFSGQRSNSSYMDHNMERWHERNTRLGVDERLEHTAGRREIRREQSVGRDVRRERNVGRDMRRAQSIGRDIRHERSFGRDVRREQSIGRDVWCEQSVERGIRREQSIGRDIQRQQSTGRDIQREQSLGRYVHREQSLGRYVHREQSVGRGMQCEQNIGRDVWREQSVGRGMQREQSIGRDMQREQSLGRDVQREQSVGRGMQREQSIGRGMQREQSIGRDIQRQQSIGCDIQREKSLGRDVQREQSVGRDMQCAQSIGRDVWREQNVGRSMQREKSIGRDLRREQSIGRDMRREQSVGRGMQREQSIGRDMRREQSIGRDVRREQSVGRDVRGDQTVEFGLRREQSIGPGMRREQSIGRDVQREQSFGSDFRRGKNIDLDVRRDQSIERDITHQRSVGRDPRSKQSVIINATRKSSADHESCQRALDSGFKSNQNNIQREKSVGRIPTRESSIGRNCAPGLSIGREVHKSAINVIDCTENNKRSSSNENIPSPQRNTSDKNIVGNAQISKSSPKIEPRLKKDMNVTKLKTKNADTGKYSSRDPRKRNDSRDLESTMRQSSSNSSRNSINSKLDKCHTSEKLTEKKYAHKKIRKQDEHHTTERENKGIVYTTENIAKGKVLNQGYGVKNYKIPKIKRPSVDDTEKIIEKEEKKIEETKKKIEETENKIEETENKIEETEKKIEETENKIEETENKYTIVKKTSIEDNAMDPNNDDHSNDINYVCSTKIHSPSKVKCGNDENSNASTSKNDTTLNYCNEPTSKDDLSKYKIDSSSTIFNDDSDDFGDILCKINQRVEATSDTDESIKESESVEMMTKIINDSGEEEFTHVELQQQSGPIKDSTLVQAETLNTEINKVFRNDNVEIKESEIVISKKGQITLTIEQQKSADISHLTMNSIENTNIALTKQALENISPADMSTNIQIDKTKILGEAQINTVQTLPVNKPVTPTKSQSETEKNPTPVILQFDNKINDAMKSQHDNETIEAYTCDQEKNTTYKDNKCDEIAEDSTKNSDSIKSDELIKEDVVSSPYLESNIDNTFKIISKDVSNDSNNKSMEKIAFEESNNSISAPDSTIQIENAEAYALNSAVMPDSTNIAENNVEASNSIVSSSHDETKSEGIEIPEKERATKEKELEALKSLGSILSVLQDKKMLEHVLNLLKDDSAETEKLKRKLSKLSEIASDDEDTDEKQPSSNKEIDQEQLSVDETIHVPLSITELHTSQQEKIDTTNNIPITTEVKLHSGEKETNLNEIIEIRNPNNDNKTNNLQNTSVTKEKTVCDEYDFVEEKSNTLSKLGRVSENKVPLKRNKYKRKNLNSSKKGKQRKKNYATNQRRTTRSESAQKVKKKGCRELEQLQEDIRDMFISEEVLNATGIRMCRLAKLTDISSELPESEEILQKETSKKCLKDGPKGITKDPKVVLEKTPIDFAVGETNSAENVKSKKKQSPKYRHKLVENIPTVTTAVAIDDNDINKHVNKLQKKDKPSEKHYDSDDESLSSLMSTASTDKYVEPKPKSKRRSTWQKGFIKSKKKKSSKELPNMRSSVVIAPSILDSNCFTDKNYCFNRKTSEYVCKLCGFVGEHIVKHCKDTHPHLEVPLSRINSKTAAKAIEQSLNTDFDTFQRRVKSKMICRFCFQLFEGFKVNLEKLFWHVVSNHTGEYKYACTQCPDDNECPASLDIPSPPSESSQLLLGYICGECHYTQISLNNLKTHVALRHDNEETEVYTINLCDVRHDEVIIKERISSKVKKLKETIQESPSTRQLRSRRENSLSESDSSKSETIGSEGDSTILSADNIPSNPATNLSRKGLHFTFEGDNDGPSEINENDKTIKSESEPNEYDSINEHNFEGQMSSEQSLITDDDIAVVWENAEFIESLQKARLIKQETVEVKTEYNPCIEYYSEPHFMITSGNHDAKSLKAYVCRVPGCSNDFRTTLLIALKRHVQAKHPTYRDIWDGYCCICKQLVPDDASISTSTSRNFSDCLNHMLINHLDDFPVIEETEVEQHSDITNTVLQAKQHIAISNAESQIDETVSPKKFISVKPMSDLIAKDKTFIAIEESEAFPMIQSVVSLQASTEMQPSDTADNNISQSVTLPTTVITECIPRDTLTKKPLKCPIEVIKTILAEKHPTVRENMLWKSIKLAYLFKCAGRFCGYVTRTASSFAEHLNAHLKLKSRDHSDVLRCGYCAWSTETSDMLTAHILREHGHCQYSCARCWYLATSPLLVDLHRTRDHADLPALQPLALDPPANAEESNATAGALPRCDAVPFYTCIGQSQTSTAMDSCTFRSYTAPKFREHLELRHIKQDEGCKCSDCGLKFSAPNLLIGHMKWHGLCLFQCTYCLFGADTELELLEHASAYHPYRRAQAYLRHIIECKDTNTRGDEKKYKALPLMRLGQQPNLQVHAKKATPIEHEECPTFEAERAHTLEKLVMQHTDPQASTTLNTILNSDEIIKSKEINTQAISKEYTPSEEVDNIVIKAERTNEQLKSIQEKTKISDEYIICLDSDEEDIPTKRPATPEKTSAKVKKTSEEVSSMNEIIDLSDDEPDLPEKETQQTQELRFGHDELFKCEKCKTNCKNDYHYRTHIPKCYPNENDRPKCPHCGILASNRKDIRFHVIRYHGPTKTYRCSECDFTHTISKKVVQHMKSEHEMLFVTVCLEAPGTNKAVLSYVIKPEEGFGTLPKPGEPSSIIPPVQTPILTKPVQKPGPKRSKKQKEVAPKPILRYGPEDLNRLPHNPIFDDNIQCTRCDFSTKVRTNLMRHLRMHADEVSVSAAAPVNPVPHLESNEMHFDKMTNLAASSNAVKSSTSTLALASSLPPETIAKYPQYVPNKDRNVCGAVGCSYMSLDEGLLKYHWETLHSGLTHGPQATTYRCVHCPPTQKLDTSRPLTASRIIGHLKMHDSRLYGCGDCGYYHYQLNMVERHAVDKHGSKARGVLKIREPIDALTSSTAAVAPSAAPTMDLKAWQCGICDFKSMLRSEVAEHCARVHTFKFQFKCTFCPYRGSVQTAVVHHQNERHPDRSALDILHVYYKERSLPTDEENNPLWMKQRHLFENVSDNIKPEVGHDPSTSGTTTVPAATKSPNIVDLAIVKSEMEEMPPKTANLDTAIEKYGAFCCPQEDHYLCPLCKIYSQRSKDAFIIHLHEELKYRRWSCSICSYKTFSKPRIFEHSMHEHKQPGDPVELQEDKLIEIWIEKLIEHQDVLIESNKATNTLEELRPVAPVHDLPNETLKKLIDKYGPFGTANGDKFSCPKCEFETLDEAKMSEHLEMETGKNRWGCSRCSQKFQFYHEAQRHCSSGNHTLFAHVMSISKDPAERTEWIKCVLRAQRRPEPKEHDVVVDEPDDSSLLVVRFEETSTAPKNPKPRTRKRRSRDEIDEEESAIERVVVTNPDTGASETLYCCPHCSLRSRHRQSINAHVFRHFNIRPYKCVYCSYTGYKGYVNKHLITCHPELPPKCIQNTLPKDQPPITGILKRNERTVFKTQLSENQPKITSKPTTPPPASTEEQIYICLICEGELTCNDLISHNESSHSGQQQQIVLKGTPVRRCGVCMALRLDAHSLKLHHDTLHPGAEMTYTMMRAGYDTREALACDHCGRMFTFMRDLKCHHDGAHASLQFQYTRKVRAPPPEALSPHPAPSFQPIIVYSGKRRRESDESSVKRVAKKSTTKLPFVARKVARKSTSKLPYTEPEIDSSSDEDEDEVSHYGTKPTPIQNYGHVRTTMRIYNTMVPVTVDKFRELIDISPVVSVKDFKKNI